MLKIRQKDLAELLGVTEAAIIQRAQRLGLQPLREGRKVYYTLDDVITILKSMKKDDEEIARIIEEIRKRCGEQDNNEGQEENPNPEPEIKPEPESTPKQTKSGSTKLPIPATHVATFLKTVDKNLATMFTKFAQQVDWYTTAMNEIGLFATIVAMSTMKLTPDELEERLMSYRNPYEFVHDVVERLMAIFRATEDAKAVYNLQKKVNEYRYYLDKALDQIEELKVKVRQYEEEILKLIAALYSYDKQFALGYIYAKGLDVAKFKTLISKDGRRPDEVEKKRIEVT